MTTIGSVEDYDELRGLSAGAFDIILVRQQKASAYTIPLSSPPNGGIFVWDENSTETENHGTIIVPKVARPNGNGRWKRQFEDALSVKWFGAKGDMKEYYKVKDKDIKKHYLGNITKDSNILYLTSSDALIGFSDHDKDKIIVIWKSGTDGAPFITTINKIVDEKNVELADIAPKDISGAYVAWGTDDTDAIQHAIDLAKETGLTVYLPPGHFIITSTLSYNTYQDMTEVRGNVVGLRDDYNSPYSLMKHGLQILGAGMQISFIHALIKEGGATIRIDGAYPDLAFSFQQTGLLKDFSITSNGSIPQTIGIDMRATWAYTIQNVHVMKMGSHGIVFHNNYFKNGTSDGDACHALHLDNVFAFKNGGWGIIVDAGDHGLSTGKIYIERCWMEQNQKGGIQWAGQIGVIERCGFYGNGVFPKGTKAPTNPTVILDIPTPVPDAYGILIKNLKGTSDNLLISGCEIQGNADVQVMVEVGANIKITQNEFKVDDLDTRFTFPSVDIQVGDGNMGDEPGKAPRTVNGCVIEDNRIRVNWTDGWGKYKNHPDEAETNKPKHTVVKVNTNAIGTVIGRWWTDQYKEDDKRRLVELVEIFKTDPATGKKSTYSQNVLEHRVHLNTQLHRDGIFGGHILFPFASAQPDIFAAKASYTPDTSRWSNYRFRIRPDEQGGLTSSLWVGNPTAHTIGAPLFFEFVNSRRSVDVTVNFDTEYNVGGSIIIPAGKTVTGILLFEVAGTWTSFSPWTCEGRPLLPSLFKS